MKNLTSEDWPQNPIEVAEAELMTREWTVQPTTASATASSIPEDSGLVRAPRETRMTELDEVVEEARDNTEHIWAEFDDSLCAGAS